MGVLTKIFWGLLEFIFPLDESAREIESITVAELTQKAGSMYRDDKRDVEAILSYRHPLVRRLIWLLKYEGNRRAVELCAEILLERIMSETDESGMFESELPILVPLPLSPARKASRGFNQTLLIAEKMQKNGGHQFFTLKPDVLRKIKDTPSQTKMGNRAERLKNLEHCFEVRNPEEIIGKRIILLDDVTTTGATFSESRKTLMEAGAKSVHCLAVAH